MVKGLLLVLLALAFVLFCANKDTLSIVGNSIYEVKWIYFTYP